MRSEATPVSWARPCRGLLIQAHSKAFSRACHLQSWATPSQVFSQRLLGGALLS